MLYDVDKNSEDRGSPMPNHDDKLIGGAIKSHKTLSTHYTTDADTNTGRLQMQNKQILGNDGTTNITLYGYNQALNKWGFFVTKPGVEVTTNTDLSQFIFNSSQDVFKIVQSPPISVTFTTNTTNYTFDSSSVAHNLGYKPAFLAMIQFPSNLTAVFPTALSATNFGNPVSLNSFIVGDNTPLVSYLTAAASVDATNVNLQVETARIPTATYTITAKIYLLQETAT